VTVSEPVRNLVYSSIAKSPADRPASAAHLARAAQALRRGDVAAAAASVPGIIGTGSLALTAGANYGNPTAATRLLPSTSVLPIAGAEPTGPTETKKRNPWTWPLIALVALLAVVLIGTIIALIIQPGKQTPTHNTSKPPTSHTHSSTPSSTPTVTRVAFQESDIDGLTQTATNNKLQSLGLLLNWVQGSPATTAAQVNTAYAADPIGNLDKGTTITVKFYGPQATPPAPDTATATPPAPGPYPANSQVAISWGQYTCPDGTPASAYNVNVNNGQNGETNPLTSSETGETITVGSSGSTTVTYTATCTGNVSSAVSLQLNLPITSATPAP
jgi:serine/threonine-protein kinase